ALAGDLGLSGSVGGMPSPGRPGATGSLSGTGLTGSLGGSLGGVGSGGSMAGSRHGINVFTADDSVEHADPGAQTAITPSQDAVNLEGVGSGSGLLDLTRESDDTSLGAELLDEITPGPGGTALGGTGMGGTALGGTAMGGSSMGATTRRSAVGDSGV